jgi:hypothetical protein
MGKLYSSCTAPHLARLADRVLHLVLDVRADEVVLAGVHVTHRRGVAALQVDPLVKAKLLRNQEITHFIDSSVETGRFQAETRRLSSAIGQQLYSAAVHPPSPTVCSRSSANWRHAVSVVRKFSPTFRHQMRLSFSTSVSFSSCSSKNPSSMYGTTYRESKL